MHADLDRRAQSCARPNSVNFLKRIAHLRAGATETLVYDLERLDSPAPSITRPASPPPPAASWPEIAHFDDLERRDRIRSMECWLDSRRTGLQMEAWIDICSIRSPAHPVG